MPDLLAGTTVKAADMPPTVSDTQDALFSFDSTVFGVDADSGTYVDCGKAFVAPTTGRVIIRFAGELDNSSGAAATQIAPAVRAGSTVGAGASVVAAIAENSIRNIDTDARAYGRNLLVSGLTAGNSYNVRLEHRVSGSVGTIEYRHVSVSPCT